MKKLNSKKGFTLMEMLIVVAIIAILVAISIPVFSAQLEKSREQTDIANMRAAKSAIVVSYMDGTLNGEGEATFAIGTAYAYDAVNGKLLATTDAAPAAYGKGTKIDGKSSADNYTNTTDYTNAYIKVSIDDTGKVTYTWEGEQEAS